MLEKVLKDYGFCGVITGCESGPVIERILFDPESGLKIKSLKNRVEDIARGIGVDTLRITQEKSNIIFEIPKTNPEVISFFSTFKKSAGELPLLLGVNTSGNPVYFDLTKAPHLLIAGTTGSGKSVGLNCFLVSLMKNKTPEELQLILIDPKKIEFSFYENNCYLRRPVVDDMQEAESVLSELVEEMESRYELLASEKCRNIAGLHAKGVKLPYIVCVIDEFADLMLTAGKRIEPLLQSLAQKARACGIHLILATQRPSVDVITGVLKANFPTRLSYRVATGFDSKTILDESGAESLLGRGDSLFSAAGKAPQRIHCCFIPDSELESFLQPLQKEPDDCTEEESGESEEDEPEESFCGMVNRFVDIACVQYPAAAIIGSMLLSAILAKIIS